MEGNQLATEIRASVQECEKYCDKTKDCKSFTFCGAREDGLCYVYDYGYGVQTSGVTFRRYRSDRCTSYHRTCEPINRISK